MKKRLFWLVRAGVVLLLLGWLVGCPMPNQPAGEPPEDALSYDQLLANLDELQGPATRSLTAAGRTVFPIARGLTLSTSDLSTYINAIKNQFAAFVKQCAAGSPYLVTPKKISWTSAAGPESGLMWVPFTWFSRKSFPVISLQHGTQVYQYCAPSRFNANPLSILTSPDLTGALQNYVECVVGGLMASAGYIVVMPDYVGFGDSGPGSNHPYVHLSLGESVKGAVQKALGLTGLVTSNGRIFLAGYSEGGYTTMAGTRALLQAGIPVAGTIPCDGAYSLSKVMLGQMLDPFTEVKVPSYLLYTAAGFAVAGENIHLSNLLKPEYLTYVTTDNHFDGYHTNADVDALDLPGYPWTMLTDDALTDYLVPPNGDAYKALAANDAWVGWPAMGMPVWLPAGPVVFIHCPYDDVVPYDNATVARAIMWEAVKQAWGKDVADLLIREVVDVQSIDLVEDIMGSIHVAAYPTAMLAAFTAITSINKTLP